MSQIKLNPETNKIYSIKKHTLLMLKSGEGIFQVDFKNYNCNAGKAVFLNPGQYFQLVSKNSWFEKSLIPQIQFLTNQIIKNS